jgi:threonine/homoserine efflux transporter RhtA
MKTGLTIAVLLALFAGACWVAYVGWTSTDVQMPPLGYLTMGLGIFFSLVVGIGLMGLVFYSNRAGYDEPPRFER